MRAIPLFLTLVIAIGPGCGDKDDASADAASEATGDSTTSAESTVPTTDAGDTTGEPTTSEVGTDSGGPAASLCEDFAAKAVMCDPESGAADEVVAFCEDELAAAGPECAPAFEAYLECVPTASCDEEAPCEQEYLAYVNCGFEAGEVCTAYGAKQAECMMLDAMEEAFYCQFGLDDLYDTDPACGAAYEAYYGCYGTLTCDDIEMLEGCEAEAMGLSVCEG